MVLPGAPERHLDAAFGHSGYPLDGNGAQKAKTGLYLLVSALVVVAGAVLGTLGMVDYYGAGVLTVFIFYFFTGTGASGGVCWGSW